jgi:hypothetical protein
MDAFLSVHNVLRDEWMQFSRHSRGVASRFYLKDRIALKA